MYEQVTKKQRHTLKQLIKTATNRNNIVFLLSLLLIGCDHRAPLESTLIEYNSRINRVLGTELPLPDYSPSVLFPSQREMRFDIAPITVNLTDFYTLQGCELSSIVAQRNTALGKTRLPSQVYLYERQVIEALQACKATIAQSTTLATKLDSWLSAKTEQLPLHWANLIQQSQEVYVSFVQTRDLIGKENHSSLNSAINSFYFLNQLRNQNETELQIDTLESHLNTIGMARFPANAWKTQELLTHYLNQMTLTLTPELEAFNCSSRKGQENAKILRNVFYLFFIKEVQPVAGQVTLLHNKVAPVFDSWINDAYLSEQFRRYITYHHNKQYLAFQNKLGDHITMWQRFLGKCNLSPTAARVGA